MAFDSTQRTTCAHLSLLPRQCRQYVHLQHVSQYLILSMSREGLSLQYLHFVSMLASMFLPLMLVECEHADIGFRLPNLELMFRMVGVNILIISYRGLANKCHQAVASAQSAPQQ